MWDLYLPNLSIFGVFTMVLILSWIKIRKERLNIIIKSGIPGPKPSFWSGNLSECFRTPNVEYDSLLVTKYGEITGYYLGVKPVILISDPELLAKIEVEQSKCFLNRPRRVPGGINPDPKRKEMLGNLPVEEWAKTRKIISPAFTPLKLKLMLPQINSKIEIFMEKIQEKLNENPLEVDFYPLFQALALDIIGETGFGVECKIQENINDPLHAAVKSEFSKSPNSKLVKFYLCFPELSWLIQPIRIIYQKILEKSGWSESSELWEQGFKAFRNRLNSPQRPDLLQQLMNSNLRECPLRVVANTVLFFEAAYETLSGSLAFLVHLLVNHPEVQEKLRQEMFEVCGSECDDQTVEKLSKLVYMDQVIKESLRMYPPQTTFIGRSGDRDFIYEKEGRKYTIPAGVHVQVALYQIQNSEKYWDQPMIFNPDRFAANQQQCGSKTGDYTWQAFGKGPRGCIGQPFAKIVLRLVLVKILRIYNLKPSSRTEERVTLNYKVATMTPKYGSCACPVAVI